MRRSRVPCPSPALIAAAVVVMLLCLGLVACGGSPAAISSPAPAGFEGTWDAVDTVHGIEHVRIVRDGDFFDVYQYPPGQGYLTGSGTPVDGKLVIDLGYEQQREEYTLSQDGQRLYLTMVTPLQTPSPGAAGEPLAFIRGGAATTSPDAEDGQDIVPSTTFTSPPAPNAVPALEPLPGTGLQGYWREIGGGGQGMLLRVVKRRDTYRVAMANTPAWPWADLGRGASRDGVLTVSGPAGAGVRIFVTPFDSGELIIRWEDQDYLTRLTRVGAKVASAAATGIMDENARASMRDALATLKRDIDRWARRNGGTYPRADAVSIDGLEALSWGLNPWTGKMLRQGTGPGDFTYSVSADGTSFTLIGRLSDGDSFSVHGGATD